MVESKVATGADAPKERTAINYCEPVELGVAHHWNIEPPNGPTSMGRCRGCNAERQFSNSTEHVSASEWRNQAEKSYANANREKTPYNDRGARNASEKRLSDEY